MPSNRLILCRGLLLQPSIFPSSRVFSNESALHIRWPKYWSINFNISASNEHPGLISFRMNWLDLLAVQGTVSILFYYILFKAVSLLKKKYTLRIRKIYLDKYLSGKRFSYFVLMPSEPSLKRVYRVKFLLVATKVRPVYIIMNITVIYIIIGN